MKKATLLAMALLMLLASSCGSYKRTAYLQDMNPNGKYPISTANDVRIHKEDKISIVVTGSSPTLAAPFNLITAVPSYDPTTGDPRYTVSENDNKPEYLVDSEGNIEFPVLGIIHVEGLTLADVKEVIANKIQEKNYMKDPIVQVEFVNFQITMLGEIGAGNFTINTGSINIFQAIALAGDLTDYANRKEIMVIRTDGGERKVYNLDLTSSSCYYSPAFYLRQNDMVYVKPIKSKMDASVENVYRWFTMSISTLSLVSTIALMFKVYGNN